MPALYSTTDLICATCSTPLPSGAPSGHCPACLWRISLVESDETVPDSEPWNMLGDHELFEEIGRGGMGIIYRARRRRIRGR